MSNLSSLLEYVDRFSPSYKDLCGEYGKSLVSQAVDKGLLSIWDKKHCTLTSSGVAFLHNPESVSVASSSVVDRKEVSSVEKHLPTDPYKFSFFTVLCAALMLVISAIHLIGMFIDFETNFVAVEAFAIIDVQYMLLQLPRNLCICLGTLLYWVSIGLGNRKLSLASVILFVCSFFCWPSIYIGVACIPVFVLGIISYVRSSRE